MNPNNPEQRSLEENEIFRQRDEYAEYVITHGNRAELSPSQIEEIVIDVRRVINDRDSFLVDRHTAIAIEDTIHEALLSSQTFRQAVVFSLREERDNLNFSHNSVLTNLYYMNLYELRDIHRRFQDIRPEEITTSTVDTVPIIGISSNSNLTNNIYQDIITISVAPNYLSEHYPIWQYTLIHEIIHAITNAGDPPEGEERIGPTDILAYRIASEMDLRILRFNNYYSSERTRAIYEHDFACLCETIYRHRERPTEVIDRLFAIHFFIEQPPEDLNNHAHQYFRYRLPALPDHPFNDDNDVQLGAAFFMGASASHCKNNLFAAKYENIIFSEKLPLTQFHLEKYNLVIAAMAVNRAEQGSGFYKEECESWKEWYKSKEWRKYLFGKGIFEHGKYEAKGSLIYGPYGLLFDDGSFAVGVKGKDIEEYGYNDNWTTLSGKNWYPLEYAGQIYFDKNGRPIAIVMTNPSIGLLGGGWSFIYNKGKWEYESEDDWDERRFAGRTESLDPYAPRFLIKNI
ncbi:MAG TPA: M85 family metallopeptidase [Arsenophonus nasoniae]